MPITPRFELLNNKSKCVITIPFETIKEDFVWASYHLQVKLFTSLTLVLGNCLPLSSIDNYQIVDGKSKSATTQLNFPAIFSLGGEKAYYDEISHSVFQYQGLYQIDKICYYSFTIDMKNVKPITTDATLYQQFSWDILSDFSHDDFYRIEIGHLSKGEFFPLTEPYYLPQTGKIYRHKEIGNESQLKQAPIIKLLSNLNINPNERYEIGRNLAEEMDYRQGVGITSEGLPDISWCLIPKGEFIYQKTQTKHLDNFYLSKYPITYLQFQAFLDAPDGYENDHCWENKNFRFKNYNYTQLNNEPKVYVNWYEARAFCKWLSTKLGFEVFLPNELQWEKAATGSNGHTYSFGDNYQVGYANINEHIETVGSYKLNKPSIVGMYPEGRFDLCDINGNVWEWCQLDNIAKNTSGNMIVRGGSWRYGSNDCISTYRFPLAPLDRKDDVGFRVACINPLTNQTGI